MFDSRADAVAAWLRYWSDALKKPEDLLLSDAGGNLLRALARSLDSWLKDPRRKSTTFDASKLESGFKGEIIRRLRSAIQPPLPPGTPAAAAAVPGPAAPAVTGPAVVPQAHPLMQVLADAAPAEFAAFEADLTRATTDAAALLGTLRPLVARVNDPQFLVGTAAGQIVAPALTLGTAERLRAVTRELAHTLLLLDDPNMLAKVSKHVLSQEGVRAALALYIEKLPADKPRTARAWTLIQEAARHIEGADFAPLLSGSVIPARDMRYPDVFLLAGAVLKVFRGEPSIIGTDGILFGIAPKTSENPSRPIDTATDDALAEKFGRATLAVLGHQAVDRTVGVFGPPLAMRHPPEADAYTAELTVLAGDVLLGWARTLPTIMEAEDDGLSHLDPVFLRGTERFLRRAIRAHAVERFRIRLDPDAVRPIGRELARLLDEESQGTDWTTADTAQLGKVARTWAARQDVQRMLGEAFAAHLTLAEEVLREVLHELADPTNRAWLSANPAKVWLRWLDDVAAAATRGEAWREVAWDHLPEATVRSVLEAIPGGYSQDRLYDAVFTVDGVNAQGERWTAGPITWFAASTLRLGEDWPARAPGEDMESEAATLRAWVETPAPSGAAARARGLEAVEAALGATTYALASVHRSAGGLRASTGRSALVARVDAGSASVGGGWTRHEMATVQAARDDQFQDFTQIYAPLVERAQAGAGQPEIERSLLRAFGWYREGRWNVNPVTRFLIYYVGIEHVLLGGRIGEKSLLPRKIADLTVSWWFARKDERERLERHHQDQILALRTWAVPGSALESTLDSIPAFDGWRDSLRPFLVRTAVEELEQRFAAARAAGETTGVAVGVYADRLRDLVTAMDAADRRRARERSRRRFTMELLSQRRNEIAHEALVAGPDALLYAQALEEIVESAIGHLASVVINAPGVATVDDALKWLTTPWLE